MRVWNGLRVNTGQTTFFGCGWMDRQQPLPPLFCVRHVPVAAGSCVLFLDEASMFLVRCGDGSSKARSLSPKSPQIPGIIVVRNR